MAAKTVNISNPFYDPDYKPGQLNEHELWWIERQEVIEKAGYRFRPRFRQGWKPPWEGTGRRYREFEDGQPLVWRVCIDATRISDCQTVMLKHIPLEEGPYELQINRKFSSEPLLSNPRNHCAPLRDVIELPGDDPIMVHDYLRPFDDPRFETYGEFVVFFGQICEGVQFMHENRVAHRDCTLMNIMFDPSEMYPEPFHPAAMKRSRDFQGKARRYTRTRCPPRYFLIDFGLSREYDPENGPPLESVLRGGDSSAPEHRDTDIPCDPFPTDVYYLGNLVRRELMNASTLGIPCYNGLEFMLPLINDMVLEDPSKRPTMDEVVARFETIKKKLSSWKLRSRMTLEDEFWMDLWWRRVRHWCRTVGYVCTLKSAIPERR
ncbi:hypothetical protein BC834DRAFT_824509 [Gloeopeniophorella convolvens]|nr:hypothetical protein BC834DRAFT_824509 [Gloeopeniophorella convolvens]